MVNRENSDMRHSDWILLELIGEKWIQHTSLTFENDDVAVMTTS